MPVQPPSREQLEWIAESLHMPLTEEELEVFAQAVGPTLETFRRLDELPDEQLPTSTGARGAPVAKLQPALQEGNACFLFAADDLDTLLD